MTRLTSLFALPAVVLFVCSSLAQQANRDLNVGAIIATAPNLKPVVELLRLAPDDAGVTAQDVRKVLNGWGPGKFDAELFLDGKTSNPAQITNGVTTATNITGAVLIPNARGLAGHNLHTWTGGWGTVTYWNAFVAVDEMHGIGTFFDERFDDAARFPIAAAAKLGHVSVGPDSDQVTGKTRRAAFLSTVAALRTTAAGRRLRRGGSGSRR